MEGFRVIPGFEEWCVTKRGKIYTVKDGNLVKTHKYGDRLFCGYKVDGTYKLLSVHKAVALAWVPNDDPTMKTVVNHKDGDPLNNWYENLEWTTYSGNNYHAVNTGLRPDAKPCRVRDFYTKEIKEFPSITQACDYMKTPMKALQNGLYSQKFGKLIAGQYEFRLKDDPEPFFYEDKPHIISPSRYMVTVKESDGSTRYLFNVRDLLQRYQLYRCPDGRSIPALVAYANSLYPDKKFTLRDGYAERCFKTPRLTAETKRKAVVATKGDEKLHFRSMTAAANHFHVDRDVIKLRLSNPESTYLGWSFKGEPCFDESQSITSSN